MERFFVKISAIVRRYLEDRFDLHAPELTTEEFLAVAGNSADLTHAHQELLRDFLQQADLIKFAGVNATDADIQRSAELAIRFLEETRQNAPLVDEPEQDRFDRTRPPKSVPAPRPAEGIEDGKQRHV